MKQIEVRFPIVAAIAFTRGLLGAGIGLLLSDKLTPTQRKIIGRSLFAIGAVSTLPLLMEVFNGSDLIEQSDSSEDQFDWHRSHSLGSELLNESVKRLF